MEKPKRLTDEKLKKSKVPVKAFNQALQNIINTPPMDNKSLKVGKKEKKR